LRALPNYSENTAAAADQQKTTKQSISEYINKKYKTGSRSQRKAAVSLSASSVTQSVLYFIGGSGESQQVIRVVVETLNS